MGDAPETTNGTSQGAQMNADDLVDGTRHVEQGGK